MISKLYISRDAIKYNLKKIKELSPEIVCVVKDDAYGLGIENIVPILYGEGERYFAVAFFEEAERVRALYNDVKIFILNYIENFNIKKALEKNYEVSVFNFSQLNEYISFLGEDVNRLKIHLKFNTGMNRLGFDFGEIKKLAEIVREWNINVESVFSHISNSENREYTKKQAELFEEIISELKILGINYRYKHIAASPALFLYEGKYNYGLSRTGMAIYGMEPLSFGDSGLKSSVILKTKIINIRNVVKGDYISYGEKNRLREDKRIAVIPIGYAQGIQMQMEGTGAYALVNGKKAPIVGEVCMDMTMLDITEIEDVKVFDEVVLIGFQGGEEITLKDMANWTGTIQDDVLTKLDRRIKKIII